MACIVCYVAVGRGMMELRKLGIEQQLWEALRKEIDQPSLAWVADIKLAAESETQLWWQWPCVCCFFSFFSSRYFSDIFLYKLRPGC